MEDRVAPLVLDWYDAHGRDLPWRIRRGPGGQAPDPYRVWLSEIMLQQTTVAAAIPHFQRFLARWPDLEALAAAEEAQVLGQWAGLGYYARARNLVKAARILALRGGFPHTEAQLRQLPGMGPYTAAAVAAIAFGQRAVVVDANIERVVARLFAVQAPLPAARKGIRAVADAITPHHRAGDFAQGLMDLGAMVCTARVARCDACPLAGPCRARPLGLAERLPIRAPKKPRPDRLGCAFWILRTGAAAPQVWLVRRPPRGMLAGMLALPDDGWSARADGQGQAGAPLADPAAARWHRLGVLRHVFTHAALELSVWAVAGAAAQPIGEGQWWPIARLDEAGLPSLFARAAALALERFQAGWNHPAARKTE